MGKRPKPQDYANHGHFWAKRSRDISRDAREQLSGSRRSSRLNGGVRSDGWTKAGRRRRHRSPAQGAAPDAEGQLSRKDSPERGAASSDVEGRTTSGCGRRHRRPVQGAASGAEGPAQGAALRGRPSRKDSPAEGAASLETDGRTTSGRRRGYRSPAQGAASGAESPAQGAALLDRSPRKGSSAQDADSLDAEERRCSGCGTLTYLSINRTLVLEGNRDGTLLNKSTTPGLGQGPTVWLSNPKGQLAGKGQGPTNKKYKISKATNAKPKETSKRSSLD